MKFFNKTKTGRGKKYGSGSKDLDGNNAMIDESAGHENIVMNKEASTNAFENGRGRSKCMPKLFSRRSKRKEAYDETKSIAAMTTTTIPLARVLDNFNDMSIEVELHGSSFHYDNIEREDSIIVPNTPVDRVKIKNDHQEKDGQVQIETLTPETLRSSVSARDSYSIGKCSSYGSVPSLNYGQDGDESCSDRSSSCSTESSFYGSSVGSSNDGDGTSIPQTQTPMQWKELMCGCHDTTDLDLMLKEEVRERNGRNENTMPITQSRSVFEEDDNHSDSHYSGSHYSGSHYSVASYFSDENDDVDEKLHCDM